MEVGEVAGGSAKEATGDPRLLPACPLAMASFREKPNNGAREPPQRACPAAAAVMRAGGHVLAVESGVPVTRLTG